MSAVLLKCVITENVLVQFDDVPRFTISKQEYIIRQEKIKYNSKSYQNTYLFMAFNSVSSAVISSSVSRDKSISLLFFKPNR